MKTSRILNLSIVLLSSLLISPLLSGEDNLDAYVCKEPFPPNNPYVSSGDWWKVQTGLYHLLSTESIRQTEKQAYTDQFTFRLISGKGFGTAFPSLFNSPLNQIIEECVDTLKWNWNCDTITARNTTVFRNGYYDYGGAICEIWTGSDTIFSFINSELESKIPYKYGHLNSAHRSVNDSLMYSALTKWDIPFIVDSLILWKNNVRKFDKKFIPEISAVETYYFRAIIHEGKVIEINATFITMPPKGLHEELEYKVSRLFPEKR